MENMDRKRFVKMAGAGSAAAAAAAGVPLAARLMSKDGGMLRFSASGGLPQSRLPSYATHMVEGAVDLRSGIGTVTTRIVAGHPGEPSLIGLPGLSRVIRITRVEVEGERYRLGGVIEDRSTLRRGESPKVEILVDREKGVVEAPLAGRKVSLPMA